MTPIPDQLWSVFEAQLFSRASTETLFNPYRDVNSDVDRAEAVRIRRRNLQAYVSHLDRPPELLVVAEAPGPWGCRFSGIPFTSEAQICESGFPIQGEASSLRPEPYREYSARIVWDVVRPVFPRIYMWNSVPLHPHKPAAPLTIRTPKAREVLEWADLLGAVHRILNPTHVAAVGRIAERSLGRMGVPCTYVRHPSQGGANLFRAGMAELIETYCK